MREHGSDVGHRNSRGTLMIARERAGHDVQVEDQDSEPSLRRRRPLAMLGP